MLMAPGLRKFALTVHVTSSVGWLGSVAGFLALAVAGLTSPDGQMVRAAYLAMELTASWVIVPLSVAALLTGLVQALGTRWGLFQHYWVVVKLLITIIATALLLLHMRPIGYMAEAVAEAALSGGELHGLQVQLVANAVAALAALLVATALSVYKPAGLTPYGGRRQADSTPPPGVGAGTGSGEAAGAGRGLGPATGAPRWVQVSGVIVIGLVLLFVILHLTGNNLGGHTRP